MPEADTDERDSGYYVYGIVARSGPERPPLEGLDAVAVEYVEHGDLAAAVTQLTLDRPPGRRAELLAHSAVVDSLAASGGVLPVQFGSVVATREQVVADLLERSHDRFVEELARLNGCLQFNLRAIYLQDVVLAEVVRDDREIAELRRRTRELPEGAVHPDLVRLGELVARAMEVTRTHDLDLIVDVVDQHARGWRSRPGGGVDHLADLALLVATDQVPAMEDSLEALAEAAHERFRLRLAGPVAPYDFAGAEAWV